MRYNFDERTNRRNTGSLKWDVGENELPMWVADMDFKTAPAVTEAVVKKAQSGIFGYQIVPDAWYDAVIGWWRSRHGFSIRKEWLCFCTGVIPALTSAVKRITNGGDNVVVQTPVYDIFFHSVENTGRHVLENRFTYTDGVYATDFADLEQKLALPATTMLILCNPHNPTGQIRTKEELQKIGELCAKYGVTVFSDEIHCDLTVPNADYVPFASVNEVCAQNSVTAIAASKAFNLAGLQSAAVFVPDENLRNKIVRGLNGDEVAEPNVFAVDATVAAFTEGGDWLDALRSYIAQNREFAHAYLRAHVPQVRPIRQNATYLLWIDCRAVTDDAQALCDFIRGKTGLYVTAGNQYRGNGNVFVRINAACPRERLQDGLQRFAAGVNAYLQKEKK